MPISPIVLQRRHAELGRIRLGQKGDRGQPQKLSSFRFTSPSERYIRDLATLYGGDPQPWDNAGVPSWEVFTTATTVPVIAVKGGLSQWLEFWQGGGCTHRCDGETNVLTGEPCDHDEKVKTRVRGKDVWVNPHTEAKPTTRLSVMLPELEAIGVWRMETHGWNAAAEIPAVAELATFVGDLVPAHLHLVERRSVRDGQTSRFVVPVLDLQIGTARLREIVAAKSGGDLPAGASAGGAAGALPAGERRALPAGGGDPYAALFSLVESATTLKELAGIWDDAKRERLVGPESRESARREEWFAAWKAKAHAIKAATEQQGSDGAASEQGDQSNAAGGDEADADAVWRDILATAGGLPVPMTEDQVKDDVASVIGVAASAASAGELGHYLQHLQQSSGSTAGDTASSTAGEAVPA